MKKRIAILFLTLGLVSIAAVKVPDLTSITTPAGNDEIYIIDVSDTTDGVSGSGRKIDWADLHSSGQNVKYVGCAESIATAITNAIAGDTLILGSCTYSISTGLIINKALKIIGQGPYATTIDAGANVIDILTVTADNVTIKNIGVSGTALNDKIAISVDASATNVFTNVNLEDLYVNISGNSTSSPYSIRYRDSGGTVKNVYIKATSTSTGRPYGLTKFVKATAEAATTLTVINSTFSVTNTTGTLVSGERAVMNWNDAASISAFDSIMYLYNVNMYCNASDSDNSGTECFQNQGPNVAPSPGVTGEVISYVYGGTIDGGNNNGNCSSTGCRDYRIDDYANVTFYGTTLAQGNETTQNNATVKRYGYLMASGMRGSLTQRQNHLAGLPIFDLTGQQGGNKPDTGAATGLVGGGILITSGAGGSATAATTTATGGAGGAFTYTSGAGGAETIATSTTNVGGAGGAITLKTGAGGAANSAATTNNGGNGGDFTLDTGAGGVGTTANGNPGAIIFKINAVEKMRVHTNGNVGIGDTTPDAFFSVGSSSQFQIDTSGNHTSSGTIKSTRTTDIGWSVVNVANQACNTTCINACVVGIDTAGTGGFLACTDATADSCLCAGAN